MGKSNRLLVSVGGNLGNTLDNFNRLWLLLEEKVGRVTAVSPYYESAPWGFESKHAFTNAAAAVLTKLTPLEALDATQEIERLLGRTRKSGNGIYHDRTMDIDLIAYNDLALQNKRLTLPHPLMQERRFVLQPLCDICPEWTHPILQRNVQSLLQECGDKSELIRILPKTSQHTPSKHF